MKRLLVCVLILNALLVSDRILLTFAASSGGNAGTATCSTEVADIDANGNVNINDAITLLSWMILGNPPELLPNCFALEVPDLEQRLADAEAMLASLDGRVTSNETGLVTVTSQATSTDTTLTGVSGQVTTLVSDVSGLDGRLTTAENSLSSLDGRVTVTEGGVTALDGRVTTSENDVLGLDTRLTTAEASVVTLEGETTLSDLGCANGEIAKVDDGEWVCSDDEIELTVSSFTRLGVNPATGLEEFMNDQTDIEFVLLLGGIFDMGSPDTEDNRDSEEGPVHQVTLDPFLMAKTEVSQAQYETIMGSNPSFFTGDDQRPVENISWDDLHALDGFLDRTGLRLPSEAQWEYACRGGASTAYSFNDDCNALNCNACATADSFMWWCGNSNVGNGPETHPVAAKQANAFGLFDMHGNVNEWCQDVYDGSFYGSPEAAGPNPVATTGSDDRVIRGGAWASVASACRSAERERIVPNANGSGIGFRVAFSLLP